MEASFLTNKRRARVIFADAVLRNEAERLGINTTRVIQGPGNTGADYTNWAVNAAEGAIFTTVNERNAILNEQYPLPPSCSTKVNWTLSPDVSGWLTLTYVDTGSLKYYESPYATIHTNGTIEPQFEPPPTFVSEIRVAINNGTYTVRFVVSGPLTTRKFNQNTGFVIICPDRTSTQNTQLHLQIL